MEIILKEDIKGLGRKGEIKNVKPGYFRNFLLPRAKASIATPLRVEKTKEIREALVMEQKEVELKAKEIAEKLKDVQLTIAVKASKKGKLFAAVHEKLILEALATQAKIELAQDQIEISSPIKTTGEYKIKLHLSSSVSHTITISVNPA